MLGDRTVAGGACAGGGCAAAGGCPKQTLPVDPRQMTAGDRRLWLETYKRHLEERLAEVNEQLAALD